MILTGIVAVLNPALDTVVSVQDLGPQGTSVKPGRVLPLIENQPALGADQVYGTPTFSIGASSVTRNWPVVTLDTSAIDTASLNATLIENGSVLRGLALVVFGISKGTIAIDPNRTQAQFVALVKAKMR